MHKPASYRVTKMSASIQGLELTINQDYKNFFEQIDSISEQLEAVTE